jgi:hypothetical protein
MEFFEADRPAAGTLSAALHLGPLQIELAGLSSELARLIHRRYHIFAAERATADDALRVNLCLDDRDYFIEPSGKPELSRVAIACDGQRVRYASYRVAGWFDTAGGRGQLVLGRGTYDNEERALENYIRAAVAWQAVGRGGALVHAASAVLNDRAYLFYGESGAGKSTLSECNRRARVVSDDLSLVLPGADGALDVVGSPFRGTYEEGAPVEGRFPLVAGFRLVQATEAAVRSAPRVRALAELIGNLPFVAEAFGERPDLFERVQHAFAAVPLAHLHFRKDDSYWDAIAAAGY